jgi:hypothetical protein
LLRRRAFRNAASLKVSANGSSWSGLVVTRGHRIVLQDYGGPWPWIVLRRSGNDTLYGTTLDPLVGATIEVEFSMSRTRLPAQAASDGFVTA